MQGVNVTAIRHFRTVLVHRCPSIPLPNSGEPPKQISLGHMSWTSVSPKLVPRRRRPPGRDHALRRVQISPEGVVAGPARKPVRTPIINAPNIDIDGFYMHKKALDVTNR